MEHKDQLFFKKWMNLKYLRKNDIIEAKNSEFKNLQGYNTAKTAGLFGIEIQGATIFAVNLKRILKLLYEKEGIDKKQGTSI
ncbi:hypothetical protein NGC39_08525 [Lysinibacillus sphaericus]|nr:hypothetical protein [Lysinibacillus sphaericus]MEB7453359.1 hypothetical protein [Lysinibacillus sphaericus]